MENSAEDKPEGPFAMLRSSHRRLEDRLLDLEAAAEDIDDPELSPAALEACESVISFFGRQVARHEEDEERSLFPRLGGFPELASVLAALAEEHEEQRQLAMDLGAAVEDVSRGRDGA